MLPYPVKLVIDENPFGKIRICPSFVNVGMQYENNVHELNFIRPYGRELDDLVLYFKIENTEYRVNISDKNVYLIDKTLTTHNTLKLQISFIRNLEETSLSNIISLGFSKSIDSDENEPINILVNNAFTSSEYIKDENKIEFRNYFGEISSELYLGDEPVDPCEEVEPVVEEDVVVLQVPYNLGEADPSWDEIPIPTLEEYNNYVLDYGKNKRFILKSYPDNIIGGVDNFICDVDYVEYKSTVVDGVETQSYIEFYYNYKNNNKSIKFTKI